MKTTKFSDFVPPQHKNNIKIDGHEDWLVVPVSRHKGQRNYNALAESNFCSALKRLADAPDTVKVFRFEDEVYGWFEILLAHPSRASEVAEIESVVNSPYPILDEEDFCEREQALDNTSQNMLL